jgi:Na+-transporting NADH:ubiquinone oxidoreductase subunit NqrE
MSGFCESDDKTGAFLAKQRKNFSASCIMSLEGCLIWFLIILSFFDCKEKMRFSVQPIQLPNECTE